MLLLYGTGVVDTIASEVDGSDSQNGTTINIDSTGDLHDDCTYEIQAGDTMFGIATSHGFNPQDFYDQNSGVAPDPNIISPGQRVNICTPQAE